MYKLAINAELGFNIQVAEMIPLIKSAGYEGILTFELTTKSKPQRNTHDIYAHMTPEEYLAEVYKRAVRVAEM